MRSRAANAVRTESKEAAELNFGWERLVLHLAMCAVSPAQLPHQNPHFARSTQPPIIVASYLFHQQQRSRSMTHPDINVRRAN